MKITPKNTKVCSSCSKDINTDFNVSFKMSPSAGKKPESSKIVSIINQKRVAKNSKTQSLF